MSENPIDEFALDCPSGGDFYICQGNSTQFIGCCKSDPCADGSGACAQADLEPASFNAVRYQSILAQDCTVSATTAEADWYTCAELAAPFMGCCASNACANKAGCPVADLAAAELGNATQARFFLTSSATSASTTATRASSSTSSTAAATTTSAEASSTATPASGLSTGAKAGLGVGAFALLALVAVLFFVIRRALLKRRGVVVRGSHPPSTPSMISYSPARITYDDPNQITNTPPVIAAPVRPMRPSLPANGQSSFTTHVSASSPLMGLVSRETSFQSTTTPFNNALGIRSASPHQGYANPAMHTVAELDGSVVYPSPPVSEMAAETPVSMKRTSMPYQPYRPGK